MKLSLFLVTLGILMFGATPAWAAQRPIIRPANDEMAPDALDVPPKDIAWPRSPMFCPVGEDMDLYESTLSRDALLVVYPNKLSWTVKTQDDIPCIQGWVMHIHTPTGEVDDWGLPTFQAVGDWWVLDKTGRVLNKKFRVELEEALNEAFGDDKIASISAVSAQLAVGDPITPVVWLRTPHGCLLLRLSAEGRIVDSDIAANQYAGGHLACYHWKGADHDFIGFAKDFRRRAGFSHWQLWDWGSPKHRVVLDADIDALEGLTFKSRHGSRDEELDVASEPEVLGPRSQVYLWKADENRFVSNDKLFEKH